MHITAISLNKNNYAKSERIYFKAASFETEESSFGIDGDPYGEETRNFLRDRLIQRAGISPLQPMTDNYTDPDTIKEVYLANFRDLGNASYSGENLMHHPKYFKLLKPSGITRVIDLINRPGLKKMCEEFGIDYFLYNAEMGYCGHDIFHNEDDALFNKKNELAKLGLSKTEYDEALEKYKAEVESEKTQTVLKIKDFIDKVNQGGFYMSCEEGIHRTTNCLALVTILNPAWKGEKIEPSPTYALKLYDLYIKLTDEHKQILGINKEYDKYLEEYFDILMKKICSQ